MGQGVQILPHACVDRTVPALHRKPGLNDISVLQHIIGKQHTVCRQQPENIRQPVDILPLRRILNEKTEEEGDKTS